MAFQRGRQAAIETPKAECLRRWPGCLASEARRYNGKIEGFAVMLDGRDIAACRSASDAWRDALCVLEDREVKAQMKKTANF